MCTCVEFGNICSATNNRTGVAKEENDILSSLFEDTSDVCIHSIPSQTVDGRVHSHNVHFFLESQQWSLQCAHIRDNKLAAILKNEHLMKLRVYHASSHSAFGEHQVPIFSNCPLLSCEISSPYHLSRSALKCEGVSTSIAYRPSLFFLCCYSMQRSTTAASLLTPIADVFFQQLFGVEFSLARSSVILMAGQSGNVLFFGACGYCDSSVSSEAHRLSNTLCCLDQPVVGIHALCLPLHLEPQYMEVDQPCSSFPTSTVANALLFIGSRGKLMVCSQAEEEKGGPMFTEFHVSGPILSSYTVHNYCIVYSTTRGIYRICLKPECMSKDDPTPSASIPILPEVQFRFPMQVGFSSSSFIVNVCQSEEGALCITTVSIDGKVRNVCVKPCKHAKEVMEGFKVEREMKQCVNAIQSTGEQTAKAQKDIKTVNSALVELNEALSILRSQSSDLQSKPFSCTIRPVSKRVGVHYFTGCVEVELHYCGVGTLRRGWTLVVSTQCVNTTLSKFTTLSLMGLETNGSVLREIKLDPIIGMPFTFSVTAYVCFSATHLYSVLGQCPVNSASVQQLLASSTGVSVVVAVCVVDTLDFMQPSEESLLQLLYQTRHSTVRDGPQREKYSLEMPIPLLESSVSCSATHGFSHVLKLLLPPHFAGDVTDSNDLQIPACTYDGSLVTFEVFEEELTVRLNVTATTPSSLVEVVNCIRRRFQNDKKHRNCFSAKEINSLKVCVCTLYNTGICLLTLRCFGIQILSREVADISGGLAELLTIHENCDKQLADLLHEMFMVFCTLQLFST